MPVCTKCLKFKRHDEFTFDARRQRPVALCKVCRNATATDRAKKAATGVRVLRPLHVPEFQPGKPEPEALRVEYVQRFGERAWTGMEGLTRKTRCQ